MCNQAVSLAAAQMEARGISTVVIQLLKEIAVKVRPPRALFVPFPHGYPLGAPHEPDLQRKVLRSMLEMAEDPSLKPPALREFNPSEGAPSAIPRDPERFSK